MLRALVAMSTAVTSSVPSALKQTLDCPAKAKVAIKTPNQNTCEYFSVMPTVDLSGPEASRALLQMAGGLPAGTTSGVFNPITAGLTVLVGVGVYYW